MKNYLATINVRLKKDVLDPQGNSVKVAAAALGAEAITSVRQGKLFDINFKAENETHAHNTINMLVQKLLANELIETSEIEIKERP